MWAAIYDNFQCCLNPENKNSVKGQGNKEVNLDNLPEKRPAFMKKKTIKSSYKKSIDPETDGSFLNKLNQNEKEENLAHSTSPEDLRSDNVGAMRAMKKRKSNMNVAETRKDLLKSAFGNN